MPIFLSAFVFPGVGQFVQRRLVVGSVFVGLFGLFFAAFMVSAFKAIIIYYSFSFESSSAVETPSVKVLVVFFLLAMITYVVSLIDVVLAQYRMLSNQENRLS